MASQWPFEDYSWWRYSLHSTLAPYLTDSSCSALLNTTATGLDASKELFDLMIEQLRTRHDPNLVSHYLQRTRAFVKWRLADPQRAQVRRTEACQGFVRRNELARDQPGVPYPYFSTIKKLLALWLPPVEGANVTGCFGPGAVAEHYPHPQRYIRLSEWCDASPHWPEVSVGHGDMTHQTARLCAVPKDFSKDRLITVEPCYNSFAQQYVRSLLLESIHCGPLRGTCMDLGYVDGQAIQRRLALKASRSKRLATLDVKDASDNIRVSDVLSVFPSWVGYLLESCRSQYFEGDAINPTSLHIYAGMGNATTFVVETLFFAAYVKAVALAYSLPRYVSVFGDDIICHTDTAERIIREGLPSLVINARKSFMGTDSIRESCGIYACEGVDITPIRVDGYMPTWSGKLAVADLWRRLTSHGELWSRQLASLIAETHELPNWPRQIDGYPSISDHSTVFDAEPPIRQHSSLQRTEYKVPCLEPVSVRYPCWDTAKYPPARVWLNAWFTGKLTTQARSSSRASNTIGVKSTGSSSYAVFPSGRYRIKRRWLECHR